MKAGDKVSLKRYAKKYPVEFDGDRIPTDPCVISSVDDGSIPNAPFGYHVTDALGRLWFAEPDELEAAKDSVSS